MSDMRTCGGPAEGSGVDPASGAVNCGQALDRLFEYLDSELETLDSERVRRHLEECAPCLDEYDVEVVVKNLVRRSCQESAPEELRVRIHERLTMNRDGMARE